MRKWILAGGLAALIGPLAACADNEYAARGPGGGVDVAYVNGPVGYDAYYDGYYGPFHDGYWSNDGYFYYSDAEGHPYRRDVDHHFRRDQPGGFHPIHGGMHPGPAEHH